MLLQTFAIMLPMATGQSEQAGGALSGAFARQRRAGRRGLYLAFALFPANRVAAPDRPRRRGAIDPAARTRDAAVAALVMLPAFTLLLAFNLTSAMRVLFTIAIVLVSLSRRDARETGAESVLSALMAGAAAVAFSVLYTFWPQPRCGACSRWRSSGCLSRPRAFTADTHGAPSRWRSRWSGCCSGPRRTSTLSKTLDWCLYSILGVLYAVWARALVLALLGWRTPPRTETRAPPNADLTRSRLLPSARGSTILRRCRSRPDFSTSFATASRWRRSSGGRYWDTRKSNPGKGDFWAPCPFHQEKSASFHVDDRKGFYYCFGCHAKGDAVTFVRETENLGFMRGGRDRWPARPACRCPRATRPPPRGPPSRPASPR